jgi:hypothetical protein
MSSREPVLHYALETHDRDRAIPKGSTPQPAHERGDPRGDAFAAPREGLPSADDRRGGGAGWPAEHLAIGIVPDTGSTRTDLGVALRQLTATFSDRLAAIVMLAVIGNLDEDPFMARTFRTEIVYPWRTSAAAALERGVTRGDLPPDADIPFLLDVIVGTVFQRAVINARSEADGLDEAILDLVLGQ